MNHTHWFGPFRRHREPTTPARALRLELQAAHDTIDRLQVELGKAWVELGRLRQERREAAAEALKPRHDYCGDYFRAVDGTGWLCVRKKGHGGQHGAADRHEPLEAAEAREALRVQRGDDGP